MDSNVLLYIGIVIFIVAMLADRRGQFIQALYRGFRTFPELRNPRILVCALEDSYTDLAEIDTGIYSRHFKRISTVQLHDLDELFDQLRKGCDILHLFCTVSEQGMIQGADGLRPATDLLSACDGSGVKVLLVANENPAKGYITGFKKGRSPLNLILTLQRKGDVFGKFFGALFDEVLQGKTLPVAWVKLAPQIPRTEHQDVPETLFLTGQAFKLIP
ncbi:MAG TPA: hypothetical protein VK699_10155 [Terriglobales bacterium]|jgi:hypothetical protein|nr:hypothetical protein [Terriglobales bacterium]